MAINSNKFVCQMKNATVSCIKFTWTHPIIFFILCSSSLICVFFPRVFKVLVFFAPLIASTALFLTAILSVSSQPKEPESKRKAEKTSTEGHEDDGRREIEIKQLKVISKHEESRITDCTEEMLVETRTEIVESKFHEKEAEEQNLPQSFEDKLQISNAGKKRVQFMVESKEEETTELGFKEEETTDVSKTSNRNYLGVVTDQETEKEEEPFLVDLKKISPLLASNAKEEESCLAKQHKSSLASGSDGEEEEGGDECEPPLENLFSLPLHSSWTRFDSSSDSDSEAFLGNLGPLFYDLDTAEDDESTNASFKAEEENPSVDFRFTWTEDDGDENLFEIVHDDASDSMSEDDNLIEIAISEQQVLKIKNHDMHQLYPEITEEPNLIDLDYSDGEGLPEQGSVHDQNLIDFSSEERGAFPEEDNLIEIDLSGDTFAVADHEEIDPVEIQTVSATKKEKNPAKFSARRENPLDASEKKSSPDLLSEPSHRDYSFMDGKTQSWNAVWPSKTYQENAILELKSIRETESTTKEVIAENIACKHEDTQVGSSFAPQHSTTTVDLIDLDSFLEMHMSCVQTYAGDDEHLKPDKTEPSDASKLNFLH